MIELNIHLEVNHVRENRGVCILSYSELLEKIAKKHSQNMASRQLLSHDVVNPFNVRIAEGGYHDNAGENIMATSNLSAFTIVDGWMNSPGHRGNLLNGSFIEEGIGISLGYPQYFITQILGSGSSYYYNIKDYSIVKTPKIENLEPDKDQDSLELFFEEEE